MHLVQPFVLGFALLLPSSFAGTFTTLTPLATPTLNPASNEINIVALPAITPLADLVPLPPSLVSPRRADPAVVVAVPTTTLAEDLAPSPVSTDSLEAVPSILPYVQPAYVPAPPFPSHLYYDPDLPPLSSAMAAAPTFTPIETYRKWKQAPVIDRFETKEYMDQHLDHLQRLVNVHVKDPQDMSEGWVLANANLFFARAFERYIAHLRSTKQWEDWRVQNIVKQPDPLNPATGIRLQVSITRQLAEAMTAYGHYEYYWVKMEAMKLDEVTEFHEDVIYDQMNHAEMMDQYFGLAEARLKLPKVPEAERLMAFLESTFICAEYSRVEDRLNYLQTKMRHIWNSITSAPFDTAITQLFPVEAFYPKVDYSSE